MATHDYVIDNASGSAVRTDLNNVLQAVLTNNSSSSAPSTTAAYMLWADTSNNILKMRNSADNAWINLFTLSGGVDVDAASNFASTVTFFDDVSFDGATAGRDIQFDRSDNALEFLDNAKATFGSGADMSLFHNGTNSIISNITGAFKVLLNSDDNAIIANQDGAVELYFDNAKKAETVTGGFTVTGTCTATAFAGDGSALTGVGGGVTSDNDNNTVAGTNAGDSFGTQAGAKASGNTLFGKNAGTAITTGDRNVAMGQDALATVDVASESVAIGYNALTTSTASGCTAVGNEALEQNTTGYHCVAMGHRALEENTTGYQQTVIGSFALDDCTTGIKNSALGWDAGGHVTTGGHNVYIGTAAGDNHQTGSNAIYVGNATAAKTTGEYQAITMGTSLESYGNYYITFGTNANGRIYNYYPSNATWTRDSDERLKKEITTNTNCGLDFINDLRTVTYKWKAPSEVPNTFTNYDVNQTQAVHKDKMYGFIAQEVKAALDKHKITDFNGWTVDSNGVQGISYEMFVMPLVKAVQELSAKVAALEAG